MRRVFVLLGVLVVGLSVALYLRFRHQEEERNRPSGGTGTVEGIEVDIVPRLSARIRAIHVEEGAWVKKGQLLVELDCAEPEALLEEAKARVSVSETALKRAYAAARAARYTARSAVASAKAARELAASARSAISVARATEKSAEEVRRALAAERKLARKVARRMSLLKAKEAGTELDLDRATGRADALEHRVRSAVASVAIARQQRTSATTSAAAALARAASAAAQSRAAGAQASSIRVQVETARGSIGVARAALKRTEIAVSECRLRAPRPGVILTRAFEPGEVVLPGSRILTLADIRRVRTTFFIPNASLADAKVGRAVDVHADAYPGASFKGKILSVSSKAEFTPRNIQTREDRDRLVYAVKVDVPNPDGRLRPGMPVEVLIPGTQRAK